MKTFNASDMAHKRTEIFEAAKDGGCVIERKNTNGDVLGQFILIAKETIESMECDYNTARYPELHKKLEGLK
ncbi:MAG: hypothetical protein JKY50_22710 [Oleispira sp.]|nr:hypothetical protein [Oleispira sp.]